MSGQPKCQKCDGIGVREIARFTIPYVWQGKLKYASIQPVPAPCSCAFEFQMLLEQQRPQPA